MDGRLGRDRAARTAPIERHVVAATVHHHVVLVHEELALELLLDAVDLLEPLLLDLRLAAAEGQALGKLEHLEGVAHLLGVVDAHHLDVLEFVEGLKLVLIGGRGRGRRGRVRAEEHAIGGQVVVDRGDHHVHGLVALALRQGEEERVAEQVGVQLVRDRVVVDVQRLQVAVVDERAAGLLGDQTAALDLLEQNRERRLGGGRSGSSCRCRLSGRVGCGRL